MEVISRKRMPEPRKAFCWSRMPSRQYSQNTLATATKRAVAMSTWARNMLARINRKKMITPRLITQKAASLSALTALLVARCIRLKMTDMEISETGKEKPRKKVSSFNFSMCHQCRYAELSMTTLDMAKPMERHNSAAW